MKPCPTCKHGLVNVECNVCHGKGAAKLSPTFEVWCPRCKGTGRIKDICPTCNGTGLKEKIGD